MTRRELLQASAAALAAARAVAQETKPGPTKFQIGCMTITYSQFSVDRALKGIAGAGYKYVGWGTSHRDASGKQVPIIAPDAPGSEAKQLAARCRDNGLQPVMMFSQIYVAAPESVKVHTRRIEQAAAAGIPFIITFGHVEKSGASGLDIWIRNLKQLGPIARANGVTLTIKQHGGNTGTGQDCSRIIQDVADEGVKMCYDAGNVLDYERKDPIPDIQACWRDIRSFAIKDHRVTPKNGDCGPGFGEIDHYKLFQPVLNTGLTMPLVCENIFAPLLPRPSEPEGVDALARRSREYLETVLAGLQQPA
jgi:sugar phosphate isomerase/epimerase